MDYENEEDDYLEQAQRKAKRTYLKEEVLDMGFSAERFTAFCKGEKGTNIDLWSFEELQDCVSRFKIHEAASKEEIKEPVKLQEESKRPESPKEREMKTEKVVEKHSNARLEVVHMVKTQSSPLDSPTESSPVSVHSKDFFPTQKVTAPAVQKSAPVSSVKETVAETEVTAPETTMIVVKKEVTVSKKDPAPDIPLTAIKKDQVIPDIPLPAAAKKDPAPSDIPLTTTIKKDPVPETETATDQEMTDTPAGLVSSSDYCLQGPILPASKLSEEIGKMDVVLESHEIVPGGLLSSSYVVYTLRTEPLNWVVKRRFNDFFWLRGALQTQFPGYYVAPIPKKQNTGRLADETILKRRRFLSRFMESIIQSPPFLRSSYLLSFLSETNNDHFNSVKKSTNKLRKPEKVEEIPSLNGGHLVNESLSTEYLQACNDLLSHSEILKKRLKRQSQALLETLKVLTGQLEGISETYKVLAELPDTLKVSPSIKGVYSSMANAFMDWSNFEGHLYDAVYDHMDTFYKFRYQEMTVLKDLLRERDTYLSSFMKAEERLNTRKEKLWAQSDPSKWEIESDSALDPASLLANKSLAFTLMLPKESANVSRAKDLFAYFNAQTFSELRRVMKETSNTELRNALALVLRQSELVEDLRRSLGSLSTDIAELV